MYAIPYSRQDVTQADIDAVVDVMRSPALTQGEVVGRFEAEFARRHGVAHAVAVGNATMALHVACLAAGVGPGKVVWTSPNSFLASANCALYCGARVDFVDIDADTRNMSVAALRDKLSTGVRPDVLIPVHFSGLPCDLEEMRALADHYGFLIVEDAAHATGATFKGAPIGSRYADLSVFSFHAVKIITTAEGGLVATQDRALADKVRLLHSHGMTRTPTQMERDSDGPWYYEQVALGYNYRMTELQAALGLSQLNRLTDLHGARMALADRYDRLLAGLPVKVPARRDDRVSSWHLYVIEVEDATTRRVVFGAMRDVGIGVNVHYIPIHTQPYYARLGFKRGSFPAAERYYSRAITLPLFPAMTHEQQDVVVAALRAALARA